jgi:hypothetical protein
MTQNGYLNNRRAFSIHVRQPQKHAREPLVRRGGKQVCDVILIVLDAGQQIAYQGIGQLIFSADQLEHLFFLDGTYGAGSQRDGGGDAKRIAGEAELAKKIMRAQDGRDG